MGQKQSTAACSPSSPFSFGIAMDAEDLTKALEYVGRDLRRKRLHVHLIVGGGSLPCLLYKTRPTCMSLNILFVSTPSPKAIETLTRSARRARKLFNLNPNWVNTTLENSIPADIREDVVYRSLVQSDVIFSSEGLTLLAIDHCYALKSTLDRLSKGPWNLCFSDAVDILRRLVYVSRGRPMTRGYLQQCYPEIELTDYTLLQLNSQFESRFGTRGVVGVNDEYIRWRREGVTWSPELEHYGSELGSSSLSRSSSSASRRSDWEKAFSPISDEEDEASIAYIFANRVGFI